MCVVHWFVYRDGCCGEGAGCSQGDGGRTQETAGRERERVAGNM